HAPPVHRAVDDDVAPDLLMEPDPLLGRPPAELVELLLADLVAGTLGARVQQVVRLGQAAHAGGAESLGSLVHRQLTSSPPRHGPRGRPAPASGRQSLWVGIRARSLGSRGSRARPQRRSAGPP